MTNRDWAYAFIAGVLVGLYLDELLSALRYREFVNDIPTFLQDERKET